MSRLVLAMLVLAACDGSGATDIPATLVFADRTDAEIGRLIQAASGSEMFAAQAQVDRFSDGLDPCPALAVDGSTVTLTGGCTTMDGTEIQGTATVTNPVSFEQVEYQYGQDTIYELTGFALTDAGFTQRFDGFTRIAGFQVWDADLTTVSFGIELRSDIHYECDVASCDLSGSGVELIGVGGARVSGTVAINGGAGGTQSFTLRGKDTLTASITQGCVAWTITGTDRKMACP